MATSFGGNIGVTSSLRKLRELGFSLILLTIAVLLGFPLSTHADDISNKKEMAVAGAEAPGFELQSLELNGNLPVQASDALVRKRATRTIEDYSGKYLFLNFWATWCTTCTEEMPSIERLGKLLGSERFQVLSINVDDAESDAKVRRYLKRYGLTFEVLRDPEGTTALAYGLTGYPESFIISPTGQFSELVDPTTNKPTTRFVSNRPWDSVEFVKRISTLIGTKSPDRH